MPALPGLILYLWPPVVLVRLFLAVEPCGLMKSFTEARLKGG